MIWKTETGNEIVIDSATPELIQEAFKIAQDRTVSFGILLNRYKSLKDKVEFSMKLRTLGKSLENQAEDLRKEAVSTFGSPKNITLRQLGWESDLSLSQVIRLPNTPVDVKLLQHSNSLYGQPYNVEDIEAFKQRYRIESTIEFGEDGLTESEYLTLLTIPTDFNLLDENQAKIIYKICDYFMSNLKPQLNDWAVRAHELQKELRKRELPVEFMPNYSRFSIV